MRRAIRNFEKPFPGNFSRSAAVASAFLLFAALPARTPAQEKGQKTYPSAEAAATALFTAIDANNTKSLLVVLGEGAKPVVESGNPDEDAERHASFCRRYIQLHRLVKEPDGTTTLYIGSENWPVPFPLVEKGGAWHFDTQAGVKEVLYRRIGHNELSAIRICQELVAAQKEYFSQHGNNVYAAKIASADGQKDGLYWAVTEGQRESPIGPLIAEASVGDGGAASSGAKGGPVPFRGYFFRVLMRQGKDAKGGAADYVVNGKMTGGFAFVAYPAEYRETGVMTFVVNQGGTVYEKDLGEKTTELVKTLKEYDPDSSWHNAEEQGDQSAFQKSK